MKIIAEDRFIKILNSFSTLDPILVFGDLGVDKYTYGEVNRISPEAPVPVLNVTKEWNKLGLAANISHNLKTLNVSSTLCGVIGRDHRGEQFNQMLKEEGIGSEGVISLNDRPTTFKERVTTDTQQICRVDYENKNPILRADEKIVIETVEKLCESHGSIIVEDYVKGLMSETLAQHVIKLFNESGKISCVDPGRGVPPAYYKGATLLKPNKAESISMVKFLGYKENSIDKISEILVDKLEIEKLIITLGSEGMALLDTKTDGILRYIPTLATEVYDVSGAGDTAISAITSAMMAGATLEEAAWIGNCASGVVVAKKGTATVSFDELQEYYKYLCKKLNG